MVLQRFHAASTSDREKKPLVQSGFIHNKHLSLRSNGPVREDMTDLVSITFGGKMTDLVNANATKIKWPKTKYNNLQPAWEYYFYDVEVF